jgi:hypothetical protein
VKKTTTITKKKTRAKTKKVSATKPAATSPAFERVIAAFAKDARVKSGKMMASVGLKLNGKIFTMFVKGTFVAKLPRDRVDALVAEGRGKHFDPGHGRPMKEWIALRADEASWVGLAREAYRFVASG